MRDIVATIQPDQDDIVRSAVEQTVCVQGAPGTGKTAVGLHRVAYLLYAYAEKLSRGGVLVIGPNRAFLAYIRHVLPALGELNVSQLSVADLLATVPVRGTDSERAAVVKGDARMAEVLRRALWDQIAGPAESIMLPRGSRRWRVSGAEIDELVDELRARGVRYGDRPRHAGPPHRPRDPDQDGGRGGELRRPHPRRRAADPPGAGRRRRDLAQGRPGAPGPGPAVGPGPPAPLRPTACSTTTSRPPSRGPRRPAVPARPAGRPPTPC